MSAIQFINHDSLLSWLESLKIEHYMCGQCQGIHISELQEHEGVFESRLFLEHDCLIFTTEVDIRNSALLAVNAELPKLNGTFANLKLFVDISDDSPARLIICDTQWVSAGLSKDQFDVFLQSAIGAKQEALQQLISADFIGAASFGEEGATVSNALH